MFSPPLHLRKNCIARGIFRNAKRLSNKFLKDNLFFLNLYNKSYFEAARRMKKRNRRCGARAE